MIIPKHIQIETINGMCTSNCIMCTKFKWKRKPNNMSFENFEKIINKFLPYKEDIQFITLHGCGEPLLDSNLSSKIALTKSLGFKGTGLATNCTELNYDLSKKLITAGLDTIIFSIDGINKRTHEAIRKGTDFEEIVSNVYEFIKLRNENGRTRVIIRFIRMEQNKSEWKDFCNYWSKKISKVYGDEVVKFDVHNWGEDIENYNILDINQDIKPEKLKCSDVFERLLIYSNGEIGLCCADDDGFYKHGNALCDNPIKIYNNSIFNYYREMMNKGKINELEYCKNCSIPKSRFLKNVKDIQ